MASLTLGLAHAYTPNETGGYGGTDHLVTSEAFSYGSLHRERGDALCKPRGKFWSLQRVDSAPRRKVCALCLKRAQRLSIEHGIAYEHLVQQGTP